MVLSEKDKVVSPEPDLVFLLGGPEKVQLELKSGFDLIALSNIGITNASLYSLIDYTGMTKKDFTENVLNLSVKTIERKKSDDRLDKRTSSHVLEIAKVLVHTYQVFGTVEKVKTWLNSPILALNNMKPVDLFYIPTGLAMVDQLLGRIEEGVYS